MHHGHILQISSRPKFLNPVTRINLGHLSYRLAPVHFYERQIYTGHMEMVSKHDKYLLNLYVGVFPN